MATENDTRSNQHTADVRRSKSTYQVEREQAADILCQRLDQAQALVLLIGGEGLETFSNLNDTLRTNVLWTLESLIDDAITAKNRLFAKATAP